MMVFFAYFNRICGLLVLLYCIFIFFAQDTRISENSPEYNKCWLNVINKHCMIIYFLSCSKRNSSTNNFTVNTTLFTIGSLKCASCSNWKVYIPKSYCFWVPIEVYTEKNSKIQCFSPVLSSWRFLIHLLELKIQLLWIPPCHTSKVASWLVDCWYEPYLLSSLSKNLLKLSKTGENSCV